MANEKKGTELAKYDEELKALAEAAAKQEAKTGGGNFITTRGGILKVGGVQVPDNQVAVVIVDSILVNALYRDEFDDDSPASPLCYAFGRTEDEMGPHDECKDAYGRAGLVEKEEFEEAPVPEGEEPGCEDCPHNRFGKALKGRGKRCKNQRRVAVIEAGKLDKDGRFEPFRDAAHFAKAPIYYLSVPPGSIVGYSQFVKKTVNALGRPPIQVFAKIATVAQEKAYKITFEALEEVPDLLVPTLLKRMKEARGSIEVPFVDREADDAPAKPAPKAAKKRKY